MATKACIHASIARAQGSEILGLINEPSLTTPILACLYTGIARARNSEILGLINEPSQIAPRMQAAAGSKPLKDNPGTLVL